eukprot:gene35357-11412_t
MALANVNGTAVEDIEGVVNAAEGCTEVRLRFTQHGAHAAEERNETGQE